MCKDSVKGHSLAQKTNLEEQDVDLVRWLSILTDCSSISESKVNV